MGRKDKLPGSNAQQRSIADYDVTNFASGVIRDEPHSELPNDALADGRDLVVYPKHVEPRTGSELYTSRTIPRIPDTSRFEALQGGYFVISEDSPFAREHVSNFIVFPGDPDTHLEITGYVDATTVRVDRSEDIDLTSGCYLRGKQNIWDFHRMSRQWVMQYYRQVYLRNLSMSTETQMVCVSRDQPFSSIGSFGVLDERTAFIFNSGGIFKLDLTDDIPVMYRINVPVPDTPIADQEQTDDTIYQYGFLYNGARLEGNGILRTRLTPSKINTETGPCAWDANSRRDYGDVWTEDPIGTGEDTYQELVCGALDNGYDVASAWFAISPNWGTFKVTINGDGPYECAADFSGVGTMANVAQRIQEALQDWFPNAVCNFVQPSGGGTGHFELSGGRTKGGTVTTLSAGTASASTTDIAEFMQGREADGATVSSVDYDSPVVVGPLFVPKVEATSPQEYQWHLTHFSIYRTRDKNNQYKQDQKTAAYNNPDRYIWEHDLRMAGAFLCSKQNGIVTAKVGMFEEADVGSVLEWDDGEREEITRYIDAYNVGVGTDYYYYGGDDKVLGAAGIGNGRVFRASQTGDRVTRTDGDTFTAADVRKTIFWADGHRSYIAEFIGSDTVRVYDSIDKVDQGAVMDPTYRMYNSTVTDAVLKSRVTTLLLRNRFWTPMPNTNIGVVVPGFLVTARRGEGKMYYCQMPDGDLNYEYLAGYHNAGYQINSSVKDDIQSLVMGENKLVILCSNRTWNAPTNVSDVVEVPEVGEALFVLGGVDILDPNIGCFDWGSIQPIGRGQYMMITSEPGGRGLRAFNGYSFGPNLVVDEATGAKKFKKDLRALQQATASIYDGNWGYVLWGRE